MPCQIATILVEPENPDNIGAVARALKNMGQMELRLVKPPRLWKKKGEKLAMAAKDRLHQAKVFSSLEAAIADVHWVIGTSRRLGPRRGQFKDFQFSLNSIQKKIQNGQKVAVLFGKESKGLDNQSIKRCDSMMNIPSSDEYPSLNLAQAVMVVAFSLFEERALKPKAEARPFSFCSQEQIEDAMSHLTTALQVLDYDKGKGLLERVQTTFRGIFKRNGMLEEEAQMIKGLSRTIRNKLSNKL